MKYSESLKKNKDFQFVYNKRKSCANKYLILYICENNTDRNRIGISVSKKVGNSVVRHRVTRLIRESYRLNEDLIKRGYDMVFVARAESRDKKYSEIESAMLHVANIQHIKI